MKAVRLHDRLDLRVEEVALPAAPPAGHVNIAVRAAGICGSDLHNYRTGQWITRRPSTAGHEFCGRIVAVGEGVDFQVGNTVVADSRVWCGECPACRSGRANVCERLGFVSELCDGGFAEQAQLPARLVVRHDASLAPEIAAMAGPLAVALHAVRRLRLPDGEPVLVVGCGTIGGLCALLLSRQGGGPVLVCDSNEGRARRVAKLASGTAVTLDAAMLGRALGGGRLRHAIDATGSAKAIAATLDLLAGGGALVGIGHGTLDLDPTVLVEREIALVGCHAFIDELPDAVAMLPALANELAGLQEVLTSLDAVPAAYDRLLAGAGAALKTVVKIAD